MAPPRKPDWTLGRSPNRQLLFNFSAHPMSKSHSTRSPPISLQRVPVIHTPDWTHSTLREIGPTILGKFVYPMLIVFRGEHAACLKHSSLFKVKILIVYHMLPLPCRSGPEWGVLPLGFRLTLNSVKSWWWAHDYILFCFFPCLDMMFFYWFD
jgi:hypothetical protein